MTNLAVGGMNVVPGGLFDATEMRIFIWQRIDPSQIARPGPDKTGGAANGVAIAPNM